MQATTRSAARQVATHENIDSFKGSGHMTPTFQDENSRKDPIDLPDAMGVLVPLKDSSKERVVSQQGPRALVELLKNTQELDPQCRQMRCQLHICMQCQDPSQALVPWSLPQHYTVDDDGLLHYIDRVLVPAQESLCSQLLELYHDCPSGGHWGRDKTLDLIQRQFTWTRIAEDITKYVATCPVCQGKAVSCHKLYGQLEPLPPLSDYSPFKEISIDWITGLPTSMRNGQAYDSILTIVCYIMK